MNGGSVFISDVMNINQYMLMTFAQPQHTVHISFGQMVLVHTPSSNVNLKIIQIQHHALSGRKTHYYYFILSHTSVWVTTLILWSQLLGNSR